METTKACSKCGEVKLAASFEPGRAACKPCAYERKRRYDLKNAHKVAERKRQYRLKNAEKTAERHRQYNLKNAEKVAERKRQYNLKNAEKVAERHRQYQLKNAKRIAERKLPYQLKNLEKTAEGGRLRVETLAPSYLAGLFGVPTSEILKNPELLELKRVALSLNRASRAITKELAK